MIILTPTKESTSWGWQHNHMLLFETTPMSSYIRRFLVLQDDGTLLEVVESDQRDGLVETLV